MWHQPVGSNAVGCSSRADAVIIFAPVYAAATYNVGLRNHELDEETSNTTLKIAPSCRVIWISI